MEKWYEIQRIPTKNTLVIFMILIHDLNQNQKNNTVISSYRFFCLDNNKIFNKCIYSSFHAILYNPHNTPAYLGSLIVGIKINHDHLIHIESAEVLHSHLLDKLLYDIISLEYSTCLRCYTHP